MYLRNLLLSFIALFFIGCVSPYEAKSKLQKEYSKECIDKIFTEKTMEIDYLNNDHIIVFSVLLENCETRNLIKQLKEK